MYIVHREGVKNFKARPFGAFGPLGFWTFGLMDIQAFGLLGFWTFFAFELLGF